jgi:hypothetical protein
MKYLSLEVKDMNKALVSLGLCLALTVLPCASHAQEFTLTKPGRILTTSLIGASLGILVGAIVAAASTSSSSTPIAVGAGVGLALGFVLAATTSTEDVEEANRPQADGGASTPGPPGALADQAGEDAVK